MLFGTNMAKDPKLVELTHKLTEDRKLPKDISPAFSSSKESLYLVVRKC